jgi:hypothetical protein
MKNFKIIFKKFKLAAFFRKKEPKMDKISIIGCFKTYQTREILRRSFDRNGDYVLATKDKQKRFKLAKAELKGPLKIHFFVIPAKAGIQKTLKILDPSFRWDDIS